MNRCGNEPGGAASGQQGPEAETLRRFNNDMGHDGDLGDAIVGNDLIGRDAYGLTLGYYGDADYKAIGSVWGTVAARPFAPLGTATTANTMGQQHKALYNGNIAHSVSTLQPFGLWDSGNGAQGQVLAQVYHYDQLNRLRTARGYTGLGSGNTWEGVADATTDRYRSDYTYDANGNIETAFRHNNAGARYDSLHYHYQTGTDGRLMRNRLYHLRDLAADGVVTAPDPEDLKKTLTAYDNTANTINTAGNTNNYRYDALGNLVHDEREGIANIAWTVAGKVKTVERTGSSALEPLHFAYGAGGQRIQKQVTNDPDLGTGYREHYIRDAQGNIMATYRYSLIPVPDTEPVEYLASLLLNERPLYGSSRLGSFAHNEELYDHAVVTNPGPDVMQPVDVNYELTDHLGNVTAVVTGRLLDGNGGGTLKQPELLSAQGYEPFGSLLPGRNYSSDAYRFGFGGMPKDDEVHSATGTSYDFGTRMYDPRVGRWLSLDPLANKLPDRSPYLFSNANPIYFVDLDGRKGVTYLTIIDKNNNEIKITLVHADDVKSFEHYNHFLDDGTTWTSKWDYTQTATLDFRDNPKGTYTESKPHLVRRVDWRAQLGEFGGIVMSSKTGEGGAPPGFGDGRIMNIEEIVGALGGMKPNELPKATVKGFVEVLKLWNDTGKNFDELFEKYGIKIEVGGKSEADKSKLSEPDPNDTICCGNNVLHLRKDSASHSNPITPPKGKTVDDYKGKKK